MAVGFDRAALQQDFSAGMFRGIREDLIPGNGAYDIANGLLDNDGAIYRRGGSSYRSTAAFGSWIPFVWHGYLGTDGSLLRTVIGSTTSFGLLADDGSVTTLGGTGLPNPRRAAAMNGTLFLPGGVTYNGTVVGTAAKAAQFYTVAGNRLLAGGFDRVDFSNIGDPATFGASNFHRVPEGLQVIGLAGLRDSAVVFTTGGVWVIGGLAMNLTDAAGNVQQRLDRYSHDLILWSDAGIAGWEGGLVVPALDAVWHMALGVASEAPAPFTRISDPIQSLYRDYVSRGFSPGGAVVYRGHYLLPIMDGANTVDLLVCRLDAPGQPWSRLTGFGAQVATLATRMNATVPRAPILLGGSSKAGRVLNLSYFEPGAQTALDADGSFPTWSVQTRDYATGSLNQNTITKLRIAYELADPAAYVPYITATQISGHSTAPATEWGRFSWGQADWSPVAASQTFNEVAPVDPYGYKPKLWWMAKRERFGRFRLDCGLPSSRLRLRYLEMFVRSNGRV